MNYIERHIVSARVVCRDINVRQFIYIYMSMCEGGDVSGCIFNEAKMSVYVLVSIYIYIHVCVCVRVRACVCASI